MIELRAKLIRGESTYGTGENVECLIEFVQHSDEHHSRNLNSDNLAWASAQIHCYLKTSNDRKQDAIADLTDSFQKTNLNSVLQSPEEVIFASTPKILFCDLKLEPGQSKTYFFTETIPRDGPPTYRGHDIKYFYKITIATQRVKSKVQSLTLPIRVLPIPMIIRNEEILGNDTNDDLTPTNPFLEKREITELEISWHHIKNLTARRLPKFYRITNKRGYVGRFCLFKAFYKLGEDIVGSLDFTDCEVKCVQFTVKLQSEEFLKSKSSEDNQQDNGKVSTYTNYHEVCLSMQQTQVILPIPLHVTPTFNTDLVDVKWRLHFEFVTSTMMSYGDADPKTGEWNAPTEIPVETMIWNLPITIYSANPLQMYSPTVDYKLLIK